MSVQCVILDARRRAGTALLRALEGGEIHVDGDVAVGVAIHLNAGAMHALDPGVELVLRLRDVAFVRRLHARIRNAQGHRALGERSVDGVLRGRAELDPLVAEAGHDAARDHRVQHPAARLVAHAVMQVAARADLLQRGQVAALVMHAGEAVPNELFRDVREPVAVALRGLLGRERGSPSDSIQRGPRAIGHSAVERAVCVA